MGVVQLLYKLKPGKFLTRLIVKTIFNFDFCVKGFFLILIFILLNFSYKEIKTLDRKNNGVVRVVIFFFRECTFGAIAARGHCGVQFLCERNREVYKW